MAALGPVTGVPHEGQWYVVGHYCPLEAPLEAGESAWTFALLASEPTAPLAAVFLFALLGFRHVTLLSLLVPTPQPTLGCQVLCIPMSIQDRL